MNRLAFRLPDDFEFDPVKHFYTWRGRRLPSVTRILDLRGLLTGREYWTDEAKERGTAVHSAIEFDIDADLDWSSVADEIAPYVGAFRKFKLETGIEIIASEQSLVHPLLFYAGKLDLIARRRANGIAVGRTRQRNILVDLKSGAYTRHYDLQIAAYDMMIEQTADILIDEWWIVSLRSNGNYSIHVVADRVQARKNFLKALELTKFIGDELS